MRMRHISMLIVGSLVSLVVLQGEAPAQTDIRNTKHDLSAGGPGPVKALGETRVCVFCHTPHNAAPESPLWNKELQPQAYSVYTSPTLKAGPLGQPSGPTKLCLSCHDGTTAMGAVINPAGGIAMSGSDFPPGSLSNLGTDLSGHHPVSFSYADSLPNPELASPPPEDLTFGGNDRVECITCHDPHNDSYGKFLVTDNRHSALCTDCHRMTGWEASGHATSTDSVVGILPRPPETWPNYTQLDEWGCEACHTPHFAPTPEQLLEFTDAPPDPYSCLTCHTSDPPPIHGTARTPVPMRSASGIMRDIAGQVRKLSAHRIQIADTGAGSATSTSGSPIQSLTCGGCHNSHQLNRRDASAPYVSGMLQGVSGMDRNGLEVPQATYQYEVCFKCHSENAVAFARIPRVINTTNVRLSFAPENASYHPVIAMGRNLNIPSVPSSFEPGMNSSILMYCTDCHSDDNGVSRGPHGSQYAPILRERCETTDGTPENFENYALCYRCHNRDSILRDESFGKRSARTTPTGGGHSGHLAAGAPCSICHDPHGVSSTLAAGSSDSGSHTHLINFDTRFVLPAPGRNHPVFQDLGTFSGSCTLVCHGKLHDNLSYP